jgi:class 3 adenylate cyclase
MAEWLETYGLGQYTRLFDENDIDLEILPDLTESDLEKLGISLGHRKKLLRAIDALSAGPEPTSSGTAAPAEKAVEPAAPSPHREAERRQLTVMFCDLVGSTTLSGKLDPEDFRAIMQAYQEACAGVVTPFEGYIAKYLGDGILAYFGYPQAHEDDAERAVRAGLGIVDAVQQLKPRPGLSLQVRVGIATGLVVVGDLVGDGVSEERAVSGATPNLAARLQTEAKPNSLLISPATRSLVSGLFAFEDLGKEHLKGISEAVQLWQVTGELGIVSRFEAAHAQGLTPLVARNEEIDLLIGRWRSAKQGEGQVVFLSGEAGIGKSRISQTLRERIAEEPHTRLRYQCSPYHRNSALYPITTQLAFAAGFAADDSSEEKLEKLETVLAPSATERHEVIPIFAAALSIPTGDRYEALTLPPPQLKERTFEVFFEQLEVLARAQPVLFLFEDAHWIDPTSLEMLNIIVKAYPSASGAINIL